MIPKLSEKKRRVSGRLLALMLAFVVMVLALPVSGALDQAQAVHEGMGDFEKKQHDHADMAGGAEEPQSAADAKAFAAKLDFSKFRLVAIQHGGQIKILDSWARQSLYTISRKRSIDGEDPVYTAMDMWLRPEQWEQKNIIYIQAVPIRQQLADLAGDQAERDRILHEGTISPAFITQERVINSLKQAAARDQRLSDAIDKVFEGVITFKQLGESTAIVPPEKAEQAWHRILPDLMVNVPDRRLMGLKDGGFGITEQTPPVPGYGERLSATILDEIAGLANAWRNGKAEAANVQLAALANTLENAQPQSYPSEFKRTVELWYNRSMSGTVAGIFFYPIAMVLFLCSISGVSPKCYKWGMGFFLLAVFLHGLGMGVRWYLAGRIPIQNMFESVMGSAFLGCLVAAGLELWKRNGLFGVAMSAVGFVATTGCLVVPLVGGTSIGENIAPAAGILMTYWLYIHVNVVIFSYSLIAASFALGAIFLLARLWYWISPVVEPAAAGVDSSEIAGIERSRRGFLETLDAANVIVMRLAFFFLGTGIILGAVWADVSWGRPWGWDPKETFALVTWLVYLILIHVRFAAPATKGIATAWLSVGGFAIMMFNWIGVNFFLVGLHSYA